MSERPAIPLSIILRAEGETGTRQNIASVAPYDGNEWDEPVFARYRPHKNTYVRWPRGSGVVYNRPEDITAGGMIVADRRLLLPGSVYAVWQHSRRDPRLGLFERVTWTGWRFAPEGREAQREAAQYLAAYGLPKALQREIHLSRANKAEGPELNLHPVPVRWVGPDLRRGPDGTATVAKVYPFSPAEWKAPWVAVPAKDGHGYAFEVEWDEGGMGRVGAFVGSPASGGRIYMGALAAGQVYCIGQNHLEEPDQSVRLHIKWDGEQFLLTDRSGNIIPQRQ